MSDARPEPGDTHITTRRIPAAGVEYDWREYTRHPVALEAARQRREFQARRLSAHEWSQWRIRQFEAGYGRAVAVGERWLS